MDSPADRAAHYRKEAAELRLMAAREIDGSIKKELLDLADQYDRLAARANSIKPACP